MTEAIIALWNDYPLDRLQEYEAWHTFEHVPERLTVPGMKGARRYVSADDCQTYFTLYELEAITVIERPEYLDLVREPTNWSRKMREHFSNVLRIPGEVAACSGNGIGGAAIVLACAVERSSAPNRLTELEAALRPLILDAKLIRFKIAIAEPNQAYEVFTQDDMTDPDTVNLVVFIEGSSTEALSDTHETLSQMIQKIFEPRKWLRRNLLKLLVSYRGEEFPRQRSELLENSAAFANSRV